MPNLQSSRMSFRLSSLLFIALSAIMCRSPHALAQTFRQVEPGQMSQQSAKAPDYIPLITPKEGSTLPLEDVSNRDDLPARTVLFELNPVNGVTHYSLQVKALTQMWSVPYTAEMDTTTVRLRLTPGRYKLRTRSYEESGAAGRWSAYKWFWIHFNPPKNIYPPENGTIVPKGGQAERIVFEWPQIKGARSYIFTLFNNKGEMIKHARIRQTYVGADLDLGTTYAWSIMPQVSKDEPEIPIAQLKLHKFRISEPNKELHKTYMEIAPVADAESYDFEFVKIASDSLASEGTVYHSKEPNYTVALAPGQYEMRVRTNFDNGFHSNWSPPRRFWVAIRPPEHVRPAEKEKIDPTDYEHAEVDLKWKRPTSGEAKIYRVFVWDEQDELVVDQYSKDTKLTVYLPHEKKYHWTVIALQDREKTRGPASLDPNETPISNFEIEHYTKLELEVSEEPSQLYVWGRYLNSVMQYTAQNYDNNTNMTENVFGGTGEMAIGYWHRKTNYGILVPYSESGFTIEGKTYAYAYGSILFGKRILDDQKRTRWRFWIGPAYKESPEILEDGDTHSLYFQRNTAWAGEIRASYLGIFNEKWGYHLYGSYLKGVKSIHTVTGLPLYSLSLLNLGAYVTYRWPKGTLGMIGYSYQVDNTDYQSADPFTNGINHVSFSGHFLSFTLEYGLQKPMR